MVIGWPSPAACSPLLVSRSTGPQPFVADRNGRSLTASLPGGGGGGTDRTIRSSELLAARARCAYWTTAVTGRRRRQLADGACTCQVNVGRAAGMHRADRRRAGRPGRPAVRQASATRSDRSRSAASAGTATVAVAVNVCPACDVVRHLQVDGRARRASASRTCAGS